MSSPITTEGLHEVHDYCCVCLSSISRDHPEVRCEFVFGGRAKRCSTCKAQNTGASKHCVSAPEGMKDVSNEMLVAAKVVCDYDEKINALEKKKEGIFSDEMIKKHGLALDSNEKIKEVDTELQAYDKLRVNARKDFDKKRSTYKSVLNTIGGLEAMITKRKLELGAQGTESKLPANVPRLLGACSILDQGLRKSQAASYHLSTTMREVFTDPGFQPTLEDMEQMDKAFRELLRTHEACNEHLTEIKKAYGKGMLNAATGRDNLRDDNEDGEQGDVVMEGA